VIVRFAIFADGITQDLDAIGAGFLGLLGILVLLAPVGVWWFSRGSRPARA